MYSVSVTHAGVRALAALDRSLCGRILSRHGTGIYCLLEDDTVLLLHDTAYGNIPFGLAMVFPLPSAPNDRAATLMVEAAQRRIRIGSLVCDCTDTEAYTDTWEDVDGARLQDGRALAFAYLRRAYAGSFVAGVIRGWTQDAYPTDENRDCGDIWEKALRDPVERLPYLASNPGDAEKTVERLLGLGPGLTPLGDDILCGYLCAAHRYLAVSPNPAVARAVAAVASIVTTRCRKKTTPQSCAFLLSSAAGEPFGMFDSLLAALLDPENRRVDVCLDALMRVGHSSGEGFVLGIVSATEMATLNPNEFISQDNKKTFSPGSRQSQTGTHRQALEFLTLQTAPPPKWRGLLHMLPLLWRHS